MCNYDPADVRRLHAFGGLLSRSEPSAPLLSDLHDDCATFVSVEGKVLHGCRDDRSWRATCWWLQSRRTKEKLGQ